MATTNLSQYNTNEVPHAEGYRFGLVVADWNSKVTHALLEGARNTLIKHGAKANDILVYHVPGSFELTLGAQYLAEYARTDAIITLGSVVQGETPHFDYVCQGVTQGVTQLNIKYNRPFIFGVLTTDTMQQALDRAGGKHGNKGDEAAITAIRMVALKQALTG